VNSPQNPTISLTVYQTENEVPAVKRRAAAQAYCQMLIDLYRREREENNESSGPSLDFL
jgi:hypothetical protein